MLKINSFSNFKVLDVLVCEVLKVLKIAFNTFIGNALRAFALGLINGICWEILALKHKASHYMDF